MRLHLAIVFVLLGILANPAHANIWTDADVQKAITVADAHWPTSPCFEHHDIHWDTFAEAQAEIDALWPNYMQVGMIGFGSYQGCKVWIVWDKLRLGVDAYGSIGMLCTLLEHEFGHNAGLLHSTDPNDVMYPELTRTSDDCRVAFPPPPPPLKHRHHRHRKHLRMANDSAKL